MTFLQLDLAFPILSNTLLANCKLKTTSCILAINSIADIFCPTLWYTQQLDINEKQIF